MVIQDVANVLKKRRFRLWVFQRKGNLRLFKMIAQVAIERPAGVFFNDFLIKSSPCLLRLRRFFIKIPLKTVFGDFREAPYLKGLGQHSVAPACHPNRDNTELRVYSF